jgi:hypothetical protein
MVDNPMLPGTGHRICNDCMKACIYQKQEPVNIPQIETSHPHRRARLRWGFEIYDLLTRWNPLQRAPHRAALQRPQRARGGPRARGLHPRAAPAQRGLRRRGRRRAQDRAPAAAPPRAAPSSASRAHTWSSTSACSSGFGGVSEYGITVRWDKNFLTLCLPHPRARHEPRRSRRRALRRHPRPRRRVAHGLHHVAIAAGAGKPTLVDIPNGLASAGSVRRPTSSWPCSSPGAYKRSSLANLQVRLPAVVIGGGLTAIDTATELRAYYVVQVEKVLERYETLALELGEAAVAAGLLRRGAGRARRGHRARPRRPRRARPAPPRRAARRAFNALLDAWGGRHHRVPPHAGGVAGVPPQPRGGGEVLRRGRAFIAERLSPKEALADDYGAVRAMRVRPYGRARRQARGHGRHRRAPRADRLHRRGHLAQRHLRARVPRRVRDERQDPRVRAAPRRARPTGAGASVPDDKGFFTSTWARRGSS